jgi:CheY-like chemotaxis protein
MSNEIFFVSNDTEAERYMNDFCTILDLNCHILSSRDQLFYSLKTVHPRLIIIDFLLDDLNGGGLCHQLKSDPQFQEIPAVLLTPFDNLGPLANKFGCNDLLTKPLTFDVFSSLVERITAIQMQN